MSRSVPSASDASLPPVSSSAPHWLLPLHVLGVILIQSTSFAAWFIVPIIAKKYFEADARHVVILTAAPVVLFCLSIFWNDLYSRLRFKPYAAIYWLVASLPLAFTSLATNFWLLAIPQVIASVGGAAYHPAAGDLLRSLYPAKSRGRVYSIIWGSSMLVSGGIGYLLGEVQNSNPDAFRVFMPALVLAQLLGVGVLTFLATRTGHDARRVLATKRGEHPVRALLYPVVHMKEVLREDPAFTRYEGAYMTYGVGWMIATALLPNLVTDKLNLPYDTIANSTHVPYQIAVVAMILPAGWLLDRLGAVRSTALSFFLLTFYPIGLMLARGHADLLAISIFYGIAHAGASMGWMLGPVAFAPTPERAAQYVSIHATLVGVRGTIFQALGITLYEIFHAFDIPLALAAIAHVWSAYQMLKLHEVMKKAGTRGRVEMRETTPPSTASVTPQADPLAGPPPARS